MDGILDVIYKANREQAAILFEAVLARYKQLYPDWEIETIAIQKSQDKIVQLNRTIAVLERLKNLQ